MWEGLLHQTLVLSFPVASALCPLSLPPSRFLSLSLSLPLSFSCYLSCGLFLLSLERSAPPASRLLLSRIHTPASFPLSLYTRVRVFSIVQSENTFYSKRTHSIVREHILYALSASPTNVNMICLRRGGAWSASVNHKSLSIVPPLMFVSSHRDADRGDAVMPEALHMHGTNPVMACAFANNWAGTRLCMHLSGVLEGLVPRGLDIYWCRTGGHSEWTAAARPVGPRVEKIPTGYGRWGG